MRMRGRQEMSRHASIKDDASFALLTFPFTHLPYLPHQPSHRNMVLQLSLIPLVAALVTASPSPGLQPESPWCKPTYDSPGWPSLDAWQRLNESVSGRLVMPTPPGAVCHVSFVEHDNTTCSLVASQWSNTSFHALNMVSTDYNDVACLPDSTYPCSVDRYPRYVVPAVNAGDVQHAISFARKTGVRLVVKGTGHDVPGRCVPIWTCSAGPVLTITGHPDLIRCPSRHTTSEVSA